MGTLDDPAADEASRDRYIGLVAASAVEGALRLTIEARDPSSSKGRSTFKGRIARAQALGIVTIEEAVELNRIRQVRNVFAHALVPVSFETPEIVEATSLFWNHPITNWSSYFLPVFPPRHRFAIVCGAFFEKLKP